MASKVYRLSTSLNYVLTVSSTRLYSRWMHRRPAKVILPMNANSNVTLKKEKIIDLQPEKLQQVKKDNLDNENNKKGTGILSEINDPPLHPKPSKGIKEIRVNKLKQRNFYLSQKKVFDDNGEIIYEKLKENDSRISSLLVKLKSKKERQRTNQMLVEGWRLIVDGLESKCKLKYVIFSQTKDLNNLHPFLPNTGVQIYKIAYKEIEKWSDVKTPPGIFGVFEMPTAENVKKLSKPLPLSFICDNIRNPGNLGGILRAAVGVGCEKVILTKGCVDLWDPKVIRTAAGAHFRQPIHTSVDWEEIPKLVNTNTSLFIADSNADDTNEIESKSVMSEIPVLPYYGVEFSNLNHVTLVIGGETEGISEDSYRFATIRSGLRLNIPLQRGVDSLNTGMATAVIAFEVRKQFLQARAQHKMERKQIT